jgi:hypothetical protein
MGPRKNSTRSFALAWTTKQDPNQTCAPGNSLNFRGNIASRVSEVKKVKNVRPTVLRTDNQREALGHSELRGGEEAMKCLINSQTYERTRRERANDVTQTEYACSGTHWASCCTCRPLGRCSNQSFAALPNRRWFALLYREASRRFGAVRRNWRHDGSTATEHTNGPHETAHTRDQAASVVGLFCHSCCMAWDSLRACDSVQR